MAYLKFLETHVISNVTCYIRGLHDEYEKSLPRPHNIQEPKWFKDLFLQFPEVWYREPDEFWAVSDSLAEALLEEGELLTNEFGFWVWGRESWNDWSLPWEEKRRKWQREDKGWIPWHLKKPCQLSSIVLTKIYQQN